MVQAGWYPDPSAARQFRWWNGRRWSEHVLRDGVALKQPVPGRTAPRRVPVWVWVVLAVLISGGAGAALSASVASNPPLGAVVTSAPSSEVAVGGAR